MVRLIVLGGIVLVGNGQNVVESNNTVMVQSILGAHGTSLTAL
ncbi:MAG: hypothetical protein ACK5KU_00170 [Beutenbergiaceae bacterium]